MNPVIGPNSCLTLPRGVGEITKFPYNWWVMTDNNKKKKHVIYWNTGLHFE